MSTSNIYKQNILETKIKIKASQLNKNTTKYILLKLQKEYEGIFTKFGLIKNNSIEIVKISLGIIEQNSFEGNIIYNVQFKAELCNPVIGSIILCNVINLNNFGILCTSKDGDNSIIEVIVPKKSLAIKSDIDLNNIKQNDKVYIEIMGKKQELNDTKIKCIGKITKTKTKTKNINSDNLIINNEDIIIEINDYEDIDDIDEDIDDEDIDDVDIDDEDIDDEDDKEDELSDGDSIHDIDDNQSILSDISENSKLMD